MTLTLKRLLSILLLAGVWGIATYAQQTGPKIIPRDRTSPSVHEGLSGEKSAGVKTNVEPLIGQTPVIFYSPFRSFKSWGSLVAPYSVPAPLETDPSTIGLKHIFSQLFFAPSTPFSRTGRTDRLYVGTKGLGGINVTDVGEAGVVGGTGPGDLYWVGFPRPANPQQLDPPVFQQPANPLDCFCRYNEQVYCPTGFNPFIRYIFYGGLNPGPASCQSCFGPANLGFNAIVKHDIYVGTDHGTHWGYPVSFPTDTGYLECLTQNQGDPSGGTPGNANYGL